MDGGAILVTARHSAARGRRRRSGTKWICIGVLVLLVCFVQFRLMVVHSMMSHLPFPQRHRTGRAPRAHGSKWRGCRRVCR